MSSTPTLQADWDAVVALFPMQRTRLGRSWNIGISSRMSRERLSTLRQRPGAGKLDRMLAKRNDARVKALRTFAAVNLEQAAAAFRITVVINVTIPIVIVTLLNLVFPGSLGEMFEIMMGDTRLTIAAVTILIASAMLLVGILSYGMANLSNARDIRHLIDLHAADRGIYYGLEDAGDLPPS